MATFVEGGRVTLGGQEFIVPKATLRTCMALEDVQKVIAAGEVGTIAGMTGVLVLLLKPAQPDLTVDQVLDLSVGSPDELLSVLVEAQRLAGFKAVNKGEAASP